MQISEAESVVLEVLWQRSPQTAEEIIAALAGKQDWAEATIKSLVNRLLTKGAIHADKDGRRYRYRPALARDDYVLTESAGLIDRLFGGRVAPLVQHFAERRKLSKRDIAELKRLIEGLE
jgi:predicted transcriptional regulator